MRRAILIITVFLLVLSAAACGKKDDTGSASASPSANDSPLTQDYENALPIIGQLMVGSFKLEGTEQAIEGAQTAELVPAWKGYRSLSSSDSASAAELNALVEQITDAMTGEQLEAIGAMQLSRQDLTNVMEEQGIARSSGHTGNLTEDQIASMRATGQARGGGQRPPGGGFGGGMGGGGQAPNPTRLAEMRARGGGGAFLARSPLYDKLIELLEAKA